MSGFAPDLLAGRRTVVIGGGGAGIGSAIAKRLGGCGARLAIVDVDPQRAADAAVDLGAAGIEAIGVTADVLDAAQVTAMVDDVVARLSGIDVLVTVVGGQIAFGLPFVPFHEYTDEQLTRSMGLNLTYVMRTLRAVLPVMLAQGTGGAIVSVGSISGGPNGSPNQAVYGAAKSGVAHLARSISAEYMPVGIRMNVVSPGSVVTPAAGTRPQAELDALFNRIPAGRRGEPSEIADAVTFLASPLSSYVCGQTIAVDGGASSCHPLPHISKLRP